MKKVFYLENKKCYDLIVINKNLLLSKNIRIDKKTELLLVITKYYYKEINFDIIWIVIHNIILETF